MPVRMKDVARRAGVSIKTVSNVVNGYRYVSPAMRVRVQSAIDELGYQPNLPARYLRKGRTGLIALALPELTNPYFAELAEEVIGVAKEHDYTVLLDHTRGRREEELLVCEGFRSQVIDGLIISPIELETEDLSNRSLGVPLVLLGERVYDLPYPHIAIDNVAAARAAVRHLVDIGRRRIAFLGARRERVREPAHLRLQGWREELTAAGLPAGEDMAVITRGWGRADGADAMERLLETAEQPPDAVFAYNDLTALGALRVLAQKGLRVPQDVAVVGFDDIEESRFAPIALTSIAPDKRTIARMAVEAVVSVLENVGVVKEASPQRPSFRLVRRESA
jgi:DNA-binding LacI/PurR family transcriptional regulator